jgi:peptidoglycan/LPS O-acetylase OafA/YrhL
VLAPDLPKRIPSLDGLRGFSVLIVTLGHISATNGAPKFLDLHYIHSLGNVGVRFFFVLSGFLITTLLLREWDQNKKINLRRFYYRRSKRIIPALAMYIFIIWSLYLSGLIDLRHHLFSDTVVESALPDLIRAVTFTANFNHDYNWYFNHLWSLSVEEQFYLLWPLLLVVSGAKRGLYLAAAVIFVVPIIRWYMYNNLDGNYVAVSREFQAVCDSLLTGSVAAITFNRVSQIRLTLQFAEGVLCFVTGFLLLAVGYASVLVSPTFAYVIGQTLSNFGIALIIQYLVRTPSSLPARIISNAVLVYFGAISYSLYLWQQPFSNFKIEAFWTSYPQNIIFSIVVAMISYNFIEKKISWRAS